MSLEVERLSCQIEANDVPGELQARGSRASLRIVALSEQLGQSRTDLEETSTDYKQLASVIPRDIANLRDRLSGILNAAMAEAEDIRAEARQSAQETLVDAEVRATAMLTEAKAEHRTAVELRRELEEQTQRIRAGVGQLREQAAAEAAETVAEAQHQAEGILAEVNRNVDAQVAMARLQINELSSVREEIRAQITEFYEQFRKVGLAGEADTPIHDASLNMAAPSQLPIDCSYSLDSGDATGGSSGNEGPVNPVDELRRLLGDPVERCPAK